MPSPQTFPQSASDTLIQAVKKVRHCLGQLSKEQIWWRPHPDLNSIGNLVLHIDGNLTQWGIVPFTQEPDLREREREFRDDVTIASEQLLLKLNKTVDHAIKIWNAADPTEFAKSIEIQGFKVSLLHAVMHTTCHFVGHTHQIIQLCRIQLGSAYRFHWSPDDDRESVPI